MMKKYFSIVVLFTTVLIPFLSYAASEYESTDKVAAGVIGTASTGTTFEFSPGKIFTPSSSFGQDLYKVTYQRVRSEGSDLALTRTLARHALSKEELSLLIPGANITEVLKKPDPKKELTPAEVSLRRKEIEEQLAEEKELADLEVLTKMEISPSEFFANGDESDSGFDLLVDLDIIETILFGKAETPFDGAGPGAPAGARVIGLPFTNTGAPAIIPVPPRIQSQPSGSKTTGLSQGQEPKSPDGSISQTRGKSSQTKPGVDSRAGGESVASCPINQSFHAAILQAQKAEGDSAAGISGAPGADSGEDTLGQISRGLSQKPDADAGRTGGRIVGEERELESTVIQPEPPADWSRPRLCSDTFCLKFEAVYQKASSYQATDNCIACHFEKINDAFKKTISHNLAPSKETGSIGEGPKCKRTLLDTLKWNFILVPQPILTPSNDDLVVKGDFIKNLVNFFEKYYSNPGRCPSGEAGGACKPDDAIERIPNQVTNQVAPGTPQSTVIQNIRTQTEAKKQEQADLLSQNRLEHEAVIQAGQFQALFSEIDTMNTFFENFIKLFNQINTESCKQLFNKEQCS